MKYNCPFCQSMMSYVVEKQYNQITGKPTVDYLVHRCKKSTCKVGTVSKFKVWEYQGEVQGVSILLETWVLGSWLSTYKLTSRYDKNITTVSKYKEEMGFNYSINRSFIKIVELNSAIKIDPTDPINTGLQVFNRIKKLLVFS